MLSFGLSSRKQKQQPLGEVWDKLSEKIKWQKSMKQKKISSKLMTKIVYLLSNDELESNKKYSDLESKILSSIDWVCKEQGLSGAFNGDDFE